MNCRSKGFQVFAFSEVFFEGDGNWIRSAPNFPVRARDLKTFAGEAFVFVIRADRSGRSRLHGRKRRMGE